jgi:RimJ/RimL family protein N-acetyltransferase
VRAGTPVVNQPVADRLPCAVTLRDGTRAEVRAGGAPGDRAALRAGFAAFSPESRYHRFLTSVSTLSEDMVSRLVDDVDGVDHVAVVLTPAGPSRSPVGVARLIRYPDQPDAADIAVSVADDWHGRGVATALLPILLAHRPAGVTRLVTEVSTDNAASLAMLRRLGPTSVEVTVPGIYHVLVELDSVPVPPDPAPLLAD